MEIIIGPEIALKDLSDAQQDELKDTCTGTNPEYGIWERTVAVRPGLRYSKNYPKPPRYLSLHRYEGDLMFVPRGLSKDLIEANPSAKVRSLLVAPKLSVPLQFVDGTIPRDYQEEAVDEVTESNFGVLEAPTGSGKTVMALMIMAKLELKTLFVVHTKRLLEQTVAEIKSKFGITPSVIGDGKFQIGELTIATVQTLLRRDMKPYSKSFGLVIFDECHHVPAKTFIEVSKIFYAKHVYGLSATVDRADGLSWAMYQTIGPKLHTVCKKSLQNSGTILKPIIKRIDTPFIPSRVYDAFEVSIHINEVASCAKRNKFLIDSIKPKLNHNNNSLILTDRVAHVELLAEALEYYLPIIYYGSMNKQDQTQAAIDMKSGKSNLTIATYTSIGEGFDVPNWDQLFLVTPFSSTTRLIQVLGRISRSAIGKSKATVYDFVDVNDQLLLDRYSKRLKAYQTI